MPQDEEEEFYTPKHGGKSYVTILSSTNDKGEPIAVFAEKAKEGDPKAKSRVNKKGVTVWEKHYGGMKIRIKSVYVIPADKSEFGAQLCISSEKRNIQVPWNSEHARKFIAVCRNIDLDEPVLIEPYKMPKTDANGKQLVTKQGNKAFRNGWTIKQGGSDKSNKLENALDMSKDGPVPQWKKLRNGNYDTSDQDEYLENYLNDWIEKHGLAPKRSSVTESDEEEEEESEEEEKTPYDDEEESSTPKKATGKVVSSKPLNKKAQAEVDEEEDGPDF